MGRPIEVTLEAFGNKKLTALFAVEELQRKRIEDVISMIISRSWQGEDERTCATIKKEMLASRGYVTTTAIGNPTMPVKFQPVRLGEPVEKYVQQLGTPEDKLRIAVTGIHSVGYQN